MAEVKIQISAEDGATRVFRAVEEGARSAFDRVDADSRKSASSVRGFGHACEIAKGRAMDFFKGLLGFEAVKSAIITAKNAIVDLANGFISVASANEQYKTTLETLLGSQQAANRAFAELNEFARKTPFQIDQVVQSFIMMKSYGLEPNIETMRILGDTTSALGGGADKMMGIARALGQIATKGRVSAEELMQLAEQGVPAYEILKDKLHLTAAEVSNIGNAGIDAQTAINALLEGLGERFGGQMEKMSSKWQGLWEEVKSLWRDFLTEIANAGAFDSLKSALKDVRDWMVDAFNSGRVKQWAEGISEALDTVLKTFKTLGSVGAAAFHALSDAIMPVAAGFTVIGAAQLPAAIGAVSAAVKGLTASFVALDTALSANPIGLIAIAAGAAYYAGKKAGEGIDRLVYSLTGIDITGLNRLNETLRWNAAQAEYAETRADKYKKKLEELGFTGVDAMKKFNQAVKNGEVVFDEASRRWVRRKEEEEAAQRRVKQSVEDTIRALEQISDVIRSAGREGLRFAKSGFSEALRAQKSGIEGMRGALEGYLSVVDAVYTRQITGIKEVISAMKEAGAGTEEIRKQEIALLQAEQALANERLNAWTQYYQSLQQLHAQAINQMKAKEQELVNIENAWMAARRQSADIEFNLRRQLMTASEAYYATQERLEEKYQAAMMLSGEAKIRALQEYQQEVAQTAHEVKEGNDVIVSKEEAVATALQKVGKAADAIEGEYQAMAEAKETEIQKTEEWVRQIETAMSKAEEMIGHYREEIVHLDEQLSEQRVLNIDTSGAMEAVNQVKAALDSIPDVTYKKVVFVHTGKASSEKPLMEKLAEIRSAMDELPSEGEHVMKFYGEASEKKPLSEKLRDIIKELTDVGDYWTEYFFKFADFEGASASQQLSLYKDLKDWLDYMQKMEDLSPFGVSTETDRSMQAAMQILSVMEKIMDGAESAADSMKSAAEEAEKVHKTFAKPGSMGGGGHAGPSAAEEYTHGSGSMVPGTYGYPWQGDIQRPYAPSPADRPVPALPPGIGGDYGVMDFGLMPVGGGGPLSRSRLPLMPYMDRMYQNDSQRQPLMGNMGNANIHINLPNARKLPESDYELELIAKKLFRKLREVGEQWRIQ